MFFYFLRILSNIFYFHAGEILNLSFMAVIINGAWFKKTRFKAPRRRSEKHKFPVLPATE
jgi:hypothetical protein